MFMQILSKLTGTNFFLNICQTFLRLHWLFRLISCRLANALAMVPISRKPHHTLYSNSTLQNKCKRQEKTSSDGRYKEIHFDLHKAQTLSESIYTHTTQKPLQPSNESSFSISHSSKPKQEKGFQNGRKGRRGCKEGARGGSETCPFTAARVRASRGASPSARCDRSRAREGDGIHVDRAEEEGWARVQEDKEVGELW